METDGDARFEKLFVSKKVIESMPAGALKPEMLKNWLDWEPNTNSVAAFPSTKLLGTNDPLNALLAVSAVA